jgi:transposase
VHAVLLKELNGFDEQVRKLAKGDARTRLLMTAPGVGPIVGLACLPHGRIPPALRSYGQGSASWHRHRADAHEFQAPPHGAKSG